MAVTGRMLSRAKFLHVLPGGLHGCHNEADTATSILMLFATLAAMIDNERCE